MKDRAREDRLADALRANLARRKAQARGVGAPTAAEPEVPATPQRAEPADRTAGARET